MRLTLILLFSASLAYPQSNVSGNARISGNGNIGQVLTNPTPPMGWSSWPEASCSTCYNGGSVVPVTEAVIEAEAANLANSTLAGLCAVEYPPSGSGCVSLTGLGYNYVNIDATWDQCVSGSPPCIFEPIASQFPDGISGVGVYVHAKGQLLGLYGSPGLIDCVNYPAQYQNEVADIDLAATWGVDEWRYDWCTSSGSIYGNSSEMGQLAFQVAGRAIQTSGRKMAYDVNYAATFAPSWFQVVGGTRVRIGADNPGSLWYSKAQGSLTFATLYQNKGHWLDFDVLMGGLTENNQTQTVTDAEARAQFNWYAITASAMIIGNLIENLDSTNLQTYANSEVIAVNQDSKGIMGTLVDTTTCGSTVCQVWARLLANGNYAIALINYDPSNAHTVSVNWSDFGQSGTWNIRDLWLHAGVGSSSTGYSVALPAWGSTIVRISQ